MKRYGKSVIALVSICAVIALALAFTNSVTKGIIEENEKQAINESLLLVVPLERHGIFLRHGDPVRHFRGWKSQRIAVPIQRRDAGL